MQLAPFRKGTRQRRQKVGVIAYAAASDLQPLELPRVGMLSRLIIQFRGTVTLSGAGALSDLGPWNLLNRIRVTANIGTASLVDVTGYGLYLMQPYLDSIGFRPDAGGAGATTPNADIHVAPVAMGANTWVLTWIVPISANAGREFDIGLVNLQAPETRITLELRTGALLDPATLVTATTGNFHIYYEFYEIPDPTRFQMPPLGLVRTLEEQQPIGQTGDNVYTVPRQGTMLQLIHLVRLNALRSDGFDTTELRFNKNDRVYAQERQWLRLQDRAFHGVQPVTGAYAWDMWRAYGHVAEGDLRDAIDTEELSTFESAVNITGGLGANNNFFHAIRRIVQSFE